MVRTFLGDSNLIIHLPGKTRHARILFSKSFRLILTGRIRCDFNRFFLLLLLQTLWLNAPRKCSCSSFACFLFRHFNVRSFVLYTSSSSSSFCCKWNNENVFKNKHDYKNSRQQHIICLVARRHWTGGKYIYIYIKKINKQIAFMPLNVCALHMVCRRNVEA